MLRGAAALGLLLVSCTRVSNTGNSLSKVEGFCLEWAEAACNEDVVTRCAAEDVADCVTGQRAACEARLPEDEFVGTNAKACLDAVGVAYEDTELDPAERDTVIRLAAPCNELLSGPGTRGDPCEDNSDCNAEDGYMCLFKTPGAAGECRVPMPVGGGDDCTAVNAQCAEGYYCNGENCIAKKTAGQACSEEVPCGDDFSCEAPEAVGDAGSDSGASAGGTCVAKAGLGDECTADGDCASDMCAIAMGSSVGICSRIIVLSPTEPICRDLR